MHDEARGREFVTALFCGLTGRHYAHQQTVRDELFWLYWASHDMTAESVRVAGQQLSSGSFKREGDGEGEGLFWCSGIILLPSSLTSSDPTLER